ncbi:MAG: S1 RNA-binding domain-containing protein [Chloroflexi bacterium]|nr:S1 RNA-binding domain-containing protein [Chloroflexota bacterium]
MNESNENTKIEAAGEPQNEDQNAATSEVISETPEPAAEVQPETGEKPAETSSEGKPSESKPKRNRSGGRRGRQNASGDQPKRLSLDAITPGMAFQGKVRNIAKFGIFVDIGAEQDGLVHISRISKDFVQDASQVVNVGDTVKVWIEDVDASRKRISLTMIDPDEETGRLEDLQPGMELEGRVVRVTDFGAFVDIGYGHDGLVHISELSNNFVNKVEDAVKVGDTVTVRILSIDLSKPRISLSMKSTASSEPEIEEQEEEAEPRTTQPESQAGIEREYAEEEIEEQPELSAFALALQRAQERQSSRNRAKGNKKGEDSSAMSDIIARTLQYHKQQKGDK